MSLWHKIRRDPIQRARLAEVLAEIRSTKFDISQVGLQTDEAEVIESWLTLLKDILG